MRPFFQESLRLAHRFAGERDVVVSQGLQSAQDPAGTAGCTRPKVVLFHQESFLARTSAFARDRNSDNSAANHRNLEMLAGEWGALGRGQVHGARGTLEIPPDNCLPLPRCQEGHLGLETSVQNGGDRRHEAGFVDPHKCFIGNVMQA